MRFKILILFSLVILVFMWQWTVYCNRPRIVFCDVGQGDATLIISGNTQFLIDSGPPNKRVLRCLGGQMPFWDKELEVLVMTHEDLDHVGGFKDIIRNYKVNNVYANFEIEAFVEQNIYPNKLSEGDLLKAGKILFEVYYPAEKLIGKVKSNEGSIVGVLSYKDKNILMLGDATADIERQLVWRGIIKNKINIVKIGHHGSDTSSSEDLVKNIDFDLAVISVGKENKFGHPNKEVLSRLERKKVLIKRTDVDGSVVFNF